MHRYSLCLLYLEYVESTGPANFLGIATEFLVRVSSLCDPSLHDNGLADRYTRMKLAKITIR